jgi:glycogen(starch) synthase
VTSILVVTNMYPPHWLGGYELSCRDVVARWRRRGHRVSVLTTTLRLAGRSGGPDDGAPESEVRRELAFYWDDHELVNPRPWRRWAIERANQRRLRKALVETAPDVVSVWNMGAMSLGLLATVHRAGIPMVLVVCDDWLVYGPRLDPWTRMFFDHGRRARLARWLTRLPTGPPDLDRVGPACFVSDFTRRRAREWSRWSLPRSAVVYSGIDPADFPLDRLAPRSGWDWRLLFVGRLDDRKGVETLIRALALLPGEATLDVVGPGPEAYVARLRELVAELNLAGRVRFRQVPRAELGAVYAAADVFVFPSEWDEPFGLVPVEAMACATPVVATGTGGSAEFLADGVNCLRYPVGDATALAAAVERLAGDPGLRARLVAAGRSTAADLNVDRLAEELEAWHLAAARGFADGEPAPRRPPVTTVPAG